MLSNERAPKAIIFTHCSSLKYGDEKAIDDPQHDPDYFQNHEQKFISDYTGRFKRFFECNQNGVLIGIVYAYVDWAIKHTIPKLKVENVNGKPCFLRPTLYDLQEAALFGVLQQAERDARRQLGISTLALPKFHYIGLGHLVNVLNNLLEVSPEMPSFLHGKKGHFTYDSPKFVEAVIRLARGDVPHLARDPIIRIDDDAEVNPESIRRLLEIYVDISSKRPFYYFSGKYGRKDGSYDVINDYAVRTHWFFKPGTEAGDKQFQKPDQDLRDRIEQAEIFLADLGALGAVQPTPRYLPERKNSRALQKLGLKIQEERAPQVISGAGLIMSRRAIELLPPFMNFESQVTWIDDHLKRQLHEMLGDVYKKDIECVINATFEQCRLPNPLTGTPAEGHFDSLGNGPRAFLTEWLQYCY